MPLRTNESKNLLQHVYTQLGKNSPRAPVPLKRISYLEPSAFAVYSEIGIFLRCLKFHEKFIRVLEHAHIHTYIYVYTETRERFILLALLISSEITVRRLIITFIARYTSLNRTYIFLSDLYEYNKWCCLQFLSEYLSIRLVRV